jgi:flagellar hook-length control protein FliK
MQVTDLYLGRLLNTKQSTSVPLPQKADSLTTGKSEFQSFFDRAVSSKAQGPGSSNLAASDSSARETSQTDEQDSQAQTAQTDSQPSTTAQQNDEPSRKADDPVPRDAAADAKSADTKAQAADAKERADATADAKASDAQESADSKLEALLDRIKDELAKGEGHNDQMLQLLAQLATLLAAATDESKSSDSSKVTLALNLDPNSKLYKIVNSLLQGQEELSADELKDVNILLELNDDKGLIIPLSELAVNGAQASGEDKGDSVITLDLTDAADASETVEIDLTITAEDMKSAQVVSISDPVLEESDLVLTIQPDKLADTGETTADKASIEAMLAKFLQDSKATVKITTGQNEETATAGTTEESAQTAKSSQSPAQAALPLLTDSGKSATEPQVSTSSSMFLASDEYLKALDKESLAKGLTKTGTDRDEVFQRLQKLIFGADSTTEISKVSSAKEAESLITGNWLQNFQQQTAGEDARNLAGVTAEDKAAPDLTNIQTGSERIDFLGRPAVQNTFSGLLSDSAEATARYAPAQDLQQSVMNQIVQRVSYSFANGTDGEIRITLRPANLGDLSLKVKVDQDVVTAKITAGSHEVKAIIENNLAQLKQSLDEAGVKVGKFEVEVNTGTNQQPSNGSQDSSGDAYLADYGAAQQSETVANNAVSLDADYSESALYGTDGDVYASSSRYSYLA